MHWCHKSSSPLILLHHFNAGTAPAQSVRRRHNALHRRSRPCRSCVRIRAAAEAVRTQRPADTAGADTAAVSAPPGLTTAHGGQSCASCVRRADRHRCLADRRCPRHTDGLRSRTAMRTARRSTELGPELRGEAPVDGLSPHRTWRTPHSCGQGTSCPLAAQRSADNTAFSGRTGEGQIQRTKLCIKNGRNRYQHERRNH